MTNNTHIHNTDSDVVVVVIDALAIFKSILLMYCRPSNYTHTYYVYKVRPMT